MIDYIFFRMYRYYEKKKDGPFASAISFNIVLIVSIFFFIVNFLNYFSGGLFSKESSIFNFGELKLIYGIICTVFIICLFIRYGNKRKREEIFRKYENSKYNKGIKMWQIFMLPIILVVTSIFIIKVIK